jgi:hypothetical protein
MNFEWKRDLIARIAHEEKPVTLRIKGFQVKSAGTNTSFNCSYFLEGLDSPERTVYGGDELQAIVFALHAVFMDLQDLRTRGVDVYWIKEGDLAGLASYFRLDQPEEI